MFGRYNQYKKLVRSRKENVLPKVNYKYNKRQKEIAKKKKRDEKLKRKQENKTPLPSDVLSETPVEAPVEKTPKTPEE